VSHGIRVSKPGGPEQLAWTELEVPPPAAGEVQLRQTAVGVNFVDVYHRTGLYPLPVPFIPGSEGAGVVTAVGSGVSSFAPGQRVALVHPGAYAEVRNVPADRLVALPDAIGDTLAASVLLKGMTAEFLLRRCRPVGPGDTILFHAAAGGVGQLAVPWARHLGATVIAVVGSHEKVALARAAGAHQVLVQSPDLAAQVKDLTQGRGVEVAYDSVGKDTLDASLEALAPRGMLVAFGQSSGKPPPLELGRLGGLRSLFVTRPSLFAYVAARADLLASSAALFDVLDRGVVKVAAPRTFPLRDAALAHRALEGRATTGSLVLLP
jgi:NADPH2:quinone reductase